MDESTTTSSGKRAGAQRVIPGPRQASDINRELCRLRRARRDLTDDDLIALVAETVTTDEASILVNEVLTAWVWHDKRTQQLEVERAACRQRADEHARRVADEQFRQQAERDSEFDRLYADPTIGYRTPVDRPTARVNIVNGRRRAEFRRWCGDRFDEWLTRACQTVPNIDGIEPSMVELFYDDWHPDGPSARAREQSMARMQDAIQELVAQTRLEVTEELLGSEFALGDGRRVTWRDATAEDHRKRITLLTANAAANAEAAARHEAAVNMLASHGVRTLGDIAAATVPLSNGAAAT